MPRQPAGDPDPNRGLRMFRQVQHEWGESGMYLRDLWARHPAIADGSVHHVQAVSSRVTPSPPSRSRACTEGCSYYTSYYSARHAKGPLLTRKGT